MRKAQELSLNLIVVGALALLVLLIIGGVMVFGGGDLMEGLTSLMPGREDVSATSFLSSCQQKCGTLNLVVDEDDVPAGAAISSSDPNYNAFKNYCCEAADLDGDGTIESNGDLGAEICALAYDDCTIGMYSGSSFCKTPLNTPEGCGYIS